MKKIIFSVLLFAGHYLGVAQQYPSVTQFMFHQLYVNPAAAGKDNHLDFSFTHRSQWSKVDGAPTTQLFQGSYLTRNEKVGLGVVATNYQAGVMQQNDIFLNYAYHLPVKRNVHLSMGLRGGATFYKAGLTELEVWDNPDYVFGEDIQQQFLPKFGFGLILYNTKKYYAGISIPDLLIYNEDNVITDNNDFKQNVMALGGADIPVSTDFVLSPSAFIRYYRNQPFYTALNCNITYLERYTGGIGYDTSNALYFLVAVEVNLDFEFGYSYQHHFDLSLLSQATHEVRLSYRTERLF